MQLAPMIVISIHVLAGVFWAGSSFGLARNGGLGAERLFAPQMVAAALVVLSGGYLWKTLHEGALGPMERVLGLGVGGAVIALAAQVFIAAPALKALRANAGDRAARRRLVLAGRAAAALLALATLAMAAARYA